MAENVINHEEALLEIEPMLDTAREGVTALETASTLIHIPTRDMAKIQTAIKKMREAALYIENRAHNLPVKSDVTTKSTLKEVLKGATQEQIDRAYAILSGQDAAYEMPAEELSEGGAMADIVSLFRDGPALEAYYEVTPEGDEE
jgi:hypothetical protein